MCDVDDVVPRMMRRRRTMTRKKRRKRRRIRIVLAWSRRYGRVM